MSEGAGVVGGDGLHDGDNAARTRPPRKAVGPCGADTGVSRSACQKLQLIEPTGRLFPVELARKPKVVEPLGAMVPL